MACELICVRHGTTKLNTADIFQGQGSDPPLSEIGERQVRATAGRLAGEAFDHAVSSDLLRARMTAHIILAGSAPALVIDHDWREFDFGAWEGLTWTQIAARFPVQAAAFSRSATEIAAPGGESFADVTARVQRALARVRAQLPDGGKALIVTHAGPLHALRRLVLGRAPHEHLDARFSPAGITRYVLHADRTEVLALDDVSHLAAEPA